MLTEREQRVLDLKNEGKNLEQISKEFGVTRERIRQIERRALLKLDCQKRREEETRKRVNAVEMLKDSINNVGIDCLNLSVRAYNCLVRANILTMKDLLNLTMEDFYKVRNLGNQSLKEVIEAVHEVGLHFYTNVEKEYAFLTNKATF